MKNKNKIIPIFLLLFVSFLFTINFVSAFLVVSPTLQSPDADEYVKGTYNINGNFVGNTGHNVTQAVFYYRLAAADAWTSIATVTNTSAEQVNYNTSWASTGIVDNTDLEFNITLRNSTDIYDSDTSTGVNIDNGVPTATLAASSLATTVRLYASQTGTFTLSIDADNTIGVDNCTIHFQTGTANLTTASSNACASTTYLTSMFGLSEGTKSYTIEVMDGNGNKTNSTSRAIYIYPGDGASAGAGVTSGGSPGAVTTIQPGTPTQQAEQPTTSTELEKPSNFGQQISGIFKGIGVKIKVLFGPDGGLSNFFKNIFTKKS